MTSSDTIALDGSHRLERFDCRVISLNDWLRRRALANQACGASRVFVATRRDEVVGYYALAAGSVSAHDATGRFRRNMPDPVPVIVLGRLAVDRSFSGRGVGRALVADAVRRTLTVAESVGVRGMLIHAIDESAADFYRRLGFTPSAIRALTLMATIADLRDNL